MGREEGEEASEKEEFFRLLLIPTRFAKKKRKSRNLQMKEKFMITQNLCDENLTSLNISVFSDSLIAPSTNYSAVNYRAILDSENYIAREIKVYQCSETWVQLTGHHNFEFPFGESSESGSGS